jgi:serine/threonine protein kinase
MLSPGAVVDQRYEIIGTLGAGGMGQVYRARRTLLGDEVALKVMRASFDPAEQSDLRQRFLRESRACAQLRHPHIVSILDFNVEPSGQPYMVMELLSGPSLRDEIELSGAVPPAQALAILAPVASALQVAHDRGITHRDLKPANIVSHRYESGERVYKVIDFGLASLEQSSDVARLTASNMFLGTLAYAAPEQLNGGPIDARTDVYALGVIAYEMLAGRRPFDGQGGITLIHQTLNSHPSSPGTHRPGLSPSIDAVVMRAIEKDPAARWSSVTEFVRALSSAIAPQQVTPAAPSAFGLETALLGRYELGEVLGRGRLGSLVYRGRHRALGVDVAIRIMRRDEQRNWDAVRERALLEARTLQVAHPNLLHVRDFGEDERLMFLVTDYVDGPSLRLELARVGRLPWPRVSRLMTQMLDATQALNARGGFVVGVNPDMIRLTGHDADERVMMSTAGIDSVQDVLSVMREQELRGAEANDQELPYVAPEVLMGQAPAAPSDVFTLGVLAYVMATGTLPYRAESVPELLGQMLQSQPASPQAIAPDVSDRASAAILDAVAGQASRRPQSAGEFRQRAFA